MCSITMNQSIYRIRGSGYELKWVVELNMLTCDQFWLLLHVISLQHIVFINTIREFQCNLTVS